MDHSRSIFDSYRFRTPLGRCAACLIFFGLSIMLIPLSSPVVAGTIEVQVNSSSDDAEENGSGSVSLTSSDLEMVFEKVDNQTIGIRFNGVNIPPAASILNAEIQFTVDEATSVPTTLLVEGSQ